MVQQKLPKILRKHIVIDDDFLRKNYVGNKLNIKQGSTAIDDTITLYKYTLGDNVTLLDDDKKKKVQNLLNNIDAKEKEIVTHESQHVHNHAIGYHYLATSDNIYECMMLALADEMSAMMAGYLCDNHDVDKSIDKTIENLSGSTRTSYIQIQFADHFRLLQRVHGDNKNLYEHKFDSKKINKILKWYFTIDGQDVMNQMSKTAKLKFGNFMVETKNEIKRFIDNYIQNQTLSNQSNYTLG